MSTPSTAAVKPAPPPHDPAALAESLGSAAEKSAKLMGEFAARNANGPRSVFADELGIGKAFLELAAKMLANPYRLAEAQMNLWWEYMSLWQASMLKMIGAPTEPVVVPAKGDKRFKHEDWHEHFLFDYIKQSYLIAARWLHDQVGSVEGLPEHTKKKVDFFTRQYIDALAPSNFALTNPEVFRETVATGGQNLVRGLNNLLDDIERGNGQLRISMTDPKAFELGVNIATTPGQVVFQNDLMQLIQYEPATKKQWQRPLLIVPPWINKYYILDLPSVLDLEILIGEEQVSAHEKKMAERGYLEGSEMANTFNLLRANDLIWTFVINNYLLGRDPFPFDLLHWNCDSTRMPAKMHSYYLRNMYMKNLLREPGGLTLGGVKIDLAKVNVPAYFVSAIEDHIAPWKTTYAGPQILGGKSRFVLSGSGHIAGMINPPAAEKYGYWTGTEISGDPDTWFAEAQQHPGSWWPD